MIRRFVLAVCFAAGTPGIACAGHIDVTIFTAPTHNMALAGGVYSPTGNRAVRRGVPCTAAWSSARFALAVRP